MATKPSQTRIVKEIASQTLQPLGLSEYQSRLWVDDHVWWLIVVEFQPSGWSKGSYLNVGIMWLIKESSQLEFHEGYRINKASFVSYESDDQFRDQMSRVAHIAADEVLALRKQFSSMPKSAKYLIKKIKQTPRWARERTKSAWELYYGAVMNGYIGNYREASILCQRFIDLPATNEYVIARKETLSSLQMLLLNQKTDDFRHEIEETIIRSRELLKLPAVQDIAGYISAEIDAPRSIWERMRRI